MNVHQQLAGREVIRLEPFTPSMIASDWWSVQSLEVESFWLPVVGPSALLIARKTARDTMRGPIEVQVCDLASAIGLGSHPTPGRNSPLVRSMARLERYGLASVSPGVFGIAPAWPPLSGWLAKRHLNGATAAAWLSEVSA